MSKSPAKYIILVYVIIFFFQLCTPFLPFYNDDFAVIELTEQQEKEKEANEKERLKEEFTDKIPSAIDICFTSVLPGYKPMPGQFFLDDVYSDVPVPPPDGGIL